MNVSVRGSSSSTCSGGNAVVGARVDEDHQRRQTTYYIRKKIGSVLSTVFPGHTHQIPYSLTYHTVFRLYLSELRLSAQDFEIVERSDMQR